MITPLVRTNKDGEPLKRPDRIEAEIAQILTLGDDEILRCSAVRDPEADDYMSSECMVHMIRHDQQCPLPQRRSDSRWLAERLMELLLKRCAAELRGSVRGFTGTAVDDVREEILGRLALLLANPGSVADFFEVRFALAMKRLRIDVCRQERRRLSALVPLDAAFDEDGAGDPLDRLEARIDRDAVPRGLSPEEQLWLKEALAVLSEEERKVFLLYRLAGVSINSRTPGVASLVELLGLSERTVRNRLRRAEAKLHDLVKEK